MAAKIHSWFGHPENEPHARLPTTELIVLSAAGRFGHFIPRTKKRTTPDRGRVGGGRGGARPIEVIRDDAEAGGDELATSRSRPGRGGAAAVDAMSARDGALRGSFKAAEARYTAPDQVDTEKLGRWLAEARDVQWDYRNLRRKGRLERLK